MKIIPSEQADSRARPLGKVCFSTVIPQDVTSRRRPGGSESPPNYNRVDPYTG